MAHRGLKHSFILNCRKAGRYFDQQNGLHLYVKESGRKYWVVRYTSNGKRRDKSLGPFPRVSLVEARRKALEHSLQTETNTFVVTTKKHQLNNQHIPTFEDFAKEYVETFAPDWKNPKHESQWRNTLKQYAFPVIGNKAISSVTTEDILEILKPIWGIKQETATRVRSRIERILSAASAKGLREGTNPASWRGHLDALLPKFSKSARVVHHKALPFSEIPDFFIELMACKAVAAEALQFTILTASRTNEVLAAEFSEITNNVWIIPKHRMKINKEHRVPLGDYSQQIVARRLNTNAQKYVFTNNTKPLSNMSMLNLLKRMNVDATTHGFRSSFRDWVSETTNYSGELAEMALSHSVRNASEAAYRRGDLLQARKGLMQAWEEFCLSKAKKG